MFHTENSQQQSDPEVECQSSSKHSEGTQPPTFQILSKIDTPEKTERKSPNQPQFSTSKNRKNTHDDEISLMSNGNDEQAVMTKRATPFTLNKDDSYDHFGRYVSSILRGLGKEKSMRLQRNISNMIARAVCPPAELARKYNSDEDKKEADDDSDVDYISTINASIISVSSHFIY